MIFVDYEEVEYENEPFQICNISDKYEIEFYQVIKIDNKKVNNYYLFIDEEDEEDKFKIFQAKDDDELEKIVSEIWEEARDKESERAGEQYEEEWQEAVDDSIDLILKYDHKLSDEVLEVAKQLFKENMNEKIKEYYKQYENGLEENYTDHIASRGIDIVEDSANEEEFTFDAFLRDVLKDSDFDDESEEIDYDSLDYYYNFEELDELEDYQF